MSGSACRKGFKISAGCPHPEYPGRFMMASTRLCSIPLYITASAVCKGASHSAGASVGQGSEIGWKHPYYYLGHYRVMCFAYCPCACPSWWGCMACEPSPSNSWPVGNGCPRRMFGRGRDALQCVKTCSWMGACLLPARLSHLTRARLAGVPPRRIPR